MSPIEPPPSVADDLYTILELSPDASEDAIRASYRRLARLRHPDKNPSDPNATARFQALQTAYSTLVDADSRGAYDSSRANSQDDDHYPQPDSRYQEAATPSWQPPPTRPVNLSSMSDDAKVRHALNRIADLERTERQIKHDIMCATDDMMAAKVSLYRCQDLIKALRRSDDAFDFFIPTSRRHHGGVFIDIKAGPKRDLYLARQWELDRWQAKVDKLREKVASLYRKFDTISELRGEYVRQYGGGSGSRRAHQETEEHEWEEMRRWRDRDRRERDDEREREREWRDIRDREQGLQDRLERMMAGRRAREEQAQRDLDERNERIRRETEKKVEQWEWETIERRLKKDQQREKQQATASKRAAKGGETKPQSEKERREREKNKAKERKRRVEEELAKFAEREARREEEEHRERERQQRDRDAEAQRERERREQQQKQSKAREEQERSDRERAERERERELRNKEELQREWARRDQERREPESERLREQHHYYKTREAPRQRPRSNRPEEVILVYTEVDPPGKSRHHHRHHTADRSKTDRYLDRIDRQRHMDKVRWCRHVGVWARVRGAAATCARCRRSGGETGLLGCPGCPKIMCRECLVEGQRPSAVRMRDAEGDEWSVRSWHSR